MTEEPAEHIDEDVLERYALGALNDEERHAVESHASACPRCMEALRREALIAAGVRLAGRADLKASLRRRIDAQERPARRWRMLAAAAVACAVTGGTLYYAWIGRWGHPVTPPPPIAQSEALPADKVVRDDGSSAGGLAGSNAPAPAAQSAVGRTAAHPPAHSPEGAASTAREELKSLETAGPATPSRVGEEGYWSEGIVEETPTHNDALQESGAARALSAGAFKKEAGELKGAAAKDAMTGERQQFHLRQKPASALPPVVGEKQRLAQGTLVPARVDQRGTTTTMTLYLDTLVDETQLRDASVRQAGGDTVIVELGKRKILYRIPTAAGAGQQGK